MDEHICGECGGAGRAFLNEAFSIAHGEISATVADLSGWRCDGCDDVEFDAASATRYAQASDELVVAARKRQAENLKRARKKLRLTQTAAAQLTGGGHNAFSRYESGIASPMPAVVNLFKLLERHPELLQELTLAEPLSAKR